MTVRTRWLSLGDFYADDERRLRSREIDFGTWWCEGDGYPWWRVSWVERTHEWYAVCFGGARRGQVELLGRSPDRPSAHEALSGWAQHCGEARGLHWARRRLAAVAPIRERELA